MTQTKQLAKGSKVYVGVLNVTPTLYGRIESLTVPKQEYETVEAPELYPMNDAGTPINTDPVELGDEILGEFEFMHYYDPRDTDATKLDSAFAAKNECTFWVDTPHATPARFTFKGKIKSLAPGQVAKKDYWKRAVTVIRTSAMTVGAPA